MFLSGKQERMRFTLTTGPESDTEFAPVYFTGTESISQLFNYEIHLVTDGVSVVPADVISQSGRFIIYDHTRTTANAKFIYGIISEFEQLDKSGDYYFYKATLVPRMWLMTHDQVNDIYIGKTIVELISEVLGNAPGATPWQSGTDFELFLTTDAEKYTTHDMFIQYNETAFDFISRWMEHYGIYYYFEHDTNASKDKLIITDRKSSLLATPSNWSLPFNNDPRNENQRQGSVQSFHSIFSPTPNRVVLTDYNYENASTACISAESTVSTSGVGTVYMHGENIKNSAHAGKLAKVRAQEISCRSAVYNGSSGSRNFHSGYLFDLSSHYHSSANQRYIVESVTHSGCQATSMVADAVIGAPDDAPVYICGFSAIPFNSSDTTFEYRPTRKTPKPSIAGSLNAKIEADPPTAEYAQPDSMGRYKVRFPWSARKSGYVRLQTPYSGTAEGFGFPLRHDADLLISFVNGDPDRPVITGAVPNSVNPAMVDNNHTKETRLVTASDRNWLMMSDDNATTATNLETYTLGNARHRAANGCRVDVGSAGASATATFESKGMNINVEDNLKIDVGGDYDMTVNGAFTETYYKDSTVKWKAAESKMTEGNSYSRYHGSKCDFMMGHSLKMTLAATESISLAQSFSLYAGLKESITIAASVGVSLGGTGSFAFGLLKFSLSAQAAKIALDFAGYNFSLKSHAMDINTIHSGLRIDTLSGTHFEIRNGYNKYRATIGIENKTTWTKVEMGINEIRTKGIVADNSAFKKI